MIREPVLLPWSGRVLDIMRPASIDQLLDQAIDDPEQNLPYWAEIWPSGIALGDLLLGTPAYVGGQSVIEIGCGIGVTACAALLADADLLVTDYSPESLELCRANCVTNIGREPMAREMNWRSRPQMIPEAPEGGWPVILAADVLYERRDIEPLAELLEIALAPAGTLFLAAPGRPVAAAFLDLMRARGWTITSRTHEGPWPDPKDEGVVVGLHELRRA